jgi:hypothetical protein
VENLIEMFNKDSQSRHNRIFAIPEEKIKTENEIKKCIMDLEKIGEETKNLSKVFDSVSVTMAGWFQPFTGNFIRRLLKRTDKIREKLSVNLKNNEKVENALKALKLMGNLQG